MEHLTVRSSIYTKLHWGSIREKVFLAEGTDQRENLKVTIVKINLVATHLCLVGLGSGNPAGLCRQCPWQYLEDHLQISPLTAVPGL